MILSVTVTIFASIGYSVLTPINMMKTEKGRKEASEGDEVLLEGITSAKILLVTLILTSVLCFLANIMMIVGVTQDKAQWIYLWINAHVFILGAHILVCFCNMFLELPDELQKKCSIYGTVANISKSGTSSEYYIPVQSVPHRKYISSPLRRPTGYCCLGKQSLFIP
ncbi:uncharacterized protein LOC111862005 isoform X2 [Cryptotermes secundus]|uniref:uncharacterized protein LOC111862005 isoform X2 n=1 Tax=Cryptotermes secundus TaxID=105785 RepID=UPI000CD7C3FF|nr:uncharacterized protein LOC111862005 isoform X2 [Cryptotermes secundus]